jgi:hypothetical protein
MVETLGQMSDETQARLFEHNIVVTNIEHAYDAETGVLQHAQQPIMPIQDSQEATDNDEAAEVLDGKTSRDLGDFI